ncbi:hypothetical protein [Bacillus cereus group sp. BfR-BA-01328]
MVVVTDRWIENGEKVVLLEPVSVMKDDTLLHLQIEKKMQIRFVYD